MKSLGADRVIDYTRDDLSGQHGRFDVVFDSAGKLPAALGHALKKPRGKFISVVTSGHAQMNVEDLELLGRLAETGKLRAVIDRVYPLEQMAEAHRYVDLGHKKGNVVITVARHEDSMNPGP